MTMVMKQRLAAVSSLMGRKPCALVALCLAGLSVVSVRAQQPSNANSCNAPDNLVQNCGFDNGLNQYDVSGNTGFLSVQTPSAQGATGDALYTGAVGSDLILTQQLPLQPLGRYRVSFDLGSNFYDATSDHIALSFDGKLLFNLQGGVETTGTPKGQTPITESYVFYHRQYYVTVKDTLAADLKIEVRGRNDPSFSYVDNLVVVYVGAGALGDPQFTGFLGQSYQVHGSSDNVYNVISSRHLQYNALFSYLDHGSCRKGTECFAHPGNYFGQVGVLIKQDEHDESADASFGYHSKRFVDAHAGGGSTKDGHDEPKTELTQHGQHSDAQLIIKAGAVDDGMTVQMGNSTLLPSNRHIKLSDQSSLFFPSRFEFYIETVDFTIKLENSDMFLNQGVSINDELVKQIGQHQAAGDKSSVSIADLPHGILGQTWQMKSYDNKWKYVQGTLNEYIVGDGILGSQFKYNRFD